MRKRLPAARHPSPPLPPDGDARRNPIGAFAPAITITLKKNDVCIIRPPARPNNTGSPRLAPDHSSSSASSPDARSPSARAAWRLATSMRPRESEGKAEGLDEDDDGAVRSERSGPQSWARAATPPAPTGDLRSALCSPTSTYVTQTTTYVQHQQPQIRSKPVLLEPIQHPCPSLLRLRLPIRRPIIRMKRMRRLRIHIDPRSLGRRRPLCQFQPHLVHVRH